jgi:hypothetical protein
MAKAPDRWHRWLTDVRFGGDPAVREQLLTELLYPVRDTVLDKAKLQPGDTVLDVGAGDGLIAFGALERLGPSRRSRRCITPSSRRAKIRCWTSTIVTWSVWPSRPGSPTSGGGRTRSALAYLTAVKES